MTGVSGSHRLPALDGLRGVAVLLVVLAHAQVPGFRFGGMTGITLFFVLSGFLITSLLLGERDSKGRVSLGAFYLRRAGRLLPALAVVIVTVGLAVLVFGGNFGEYAHGAVFAAFYGANFAQVAHVPLPFLGHTWSLSIEEQFYLVWPALLIVTPRAWLKRVLLAGLAVAVLLRVVTYGGVEDYAAVYYGTATNAFALLTGCAAAVFAREGRRVSRPLGVAGLAGVLAVTAIPEGAYERDAAIVILGMIPVAGLAALAVMSAAQERAPGWLLWRPLVFAGTISYGLYLWHVVPYGIGGDLRVHTNWVENLGLSAVAVLVAWASFRWLERPILRQVHWRLAERSLLGDGELHELVGARQHGERRDVGTPHRPDRVRASG